MQLFRGTKAQKKFIFQQVIALNFRFPPRKILKNIQKKLFKLFIK